MNNSDLRQVLELRNGIKISEAELKQIVTKEILRIGLSPAVVGYRYFKELLMCSLQEKYEYHGVMELFHLVAELFHVSVGSLERSVRTLISTSFYDNNGFKILSDFYGLKEFALPSAGQALAQITEYILYNMPEPDMNSDSTYKTDGFKSSNKI